MRDVVRKSREYDHELETLRVFSKGDNYIKTHLGVLEKNAKHGIPTLISLQKDFSTTSEKILKQSLLEKQNKSILDKVAIKLSSVVHIRKVTGDEDSQNKEDIIARSNFAIESGDIELAITELGKLTESDKKLLASWIEKAKDYTNAINASEAILRYTTTPATKNTNQAADL